MPHSNHHASTSPLSITTSFPVLDAATSNTATATTTTNNNGIISEVANDNIDDGSGGVMTDVVVNNNAAINVNNIVDIDNNNDNNNKGAISAIAPQQLNYVICDNLKAEAPGKGLTVGKIMKGLKLQNLMAQ